MYDARSVTPKSKRNLMDHIGPINPACDEIHRTKHRQTGENYKEAMTRIASGLKDNDNHFHTFRDILLQMKFLPAGRVQAAIGATKNVTPYNCFVSGTIEDSFVDGAGSIMARATEAAATMRMGGGIGYDFSTLRPRGDMIRKLQSQTGGPVGFLSIFDAVCANTASSGNRRGAQMGVLRVDHPDVEEFIRAKHNHDQLTGFNLSLAITDKFMECVISGKPFPLQFQGQTYREIDAQALWETIMRSTWDWAEPGVIFIDQVNRMNNLSYCETIAATNPCGEQPLPPFGACLLGSINLPKYVSRRTVAAVGEIEWSFNWSEFEEDIAPIVWAMDNVPDRAIFPLYEQEKEAKSKRRMGIGVTGLANAAEACGFPYGSQEFLEFEARILKTLNVKAYEASVESAMVKGAFPLYDERFLQSAFLNGEALAGTGVKEMIAKHGIRNSHLTSIAPTGSISFGADNVSSGIEPVFSYEQKRRVKMHDGERDVLLRDYGLEYFGVKGRRATDLEAHEHVSVLTCATRYVDSAVSKTCNVSPDIGWDDFKGLYIQAWEHGAKGCTTYTPQEEGRGAVIESLDEKPVEEAWDPTMCVIDPATGKKDCS